MSVLQFLAVLTVALVLLAVAGHGLWLLGAGLFRGLSGVEAGRPCRACGAPRGIIGGRCRSCGFVPAAAFAPGPSDLDETTRHLQRLVWRGEISSDAYAQLTEILSRERQRTSGAKAAAEPKAPPPAADGAKPPVFPQAAADAGERALAEPPPVRRAAAAPLAREEAAVQPSIGARPSAGVERPSVPLATRRPLAAEPPVEPPRRPTPSGTLADILQSFMEERNIRWGELIGGMLIVGSAIGLVISLWSTLSRTIHYLPALIFMLVTAAIHGAGIYTLKRWNLKSTSRGVLIIGSLLIPLNFLALIALSREQGRLLPSLDGRYAAMAGAAMIAFAAMAYFASRSLMVEGWWRLAAAVMGTCLGQLIINQSVSESMAMWTISLLMLTPLASFLVGVVGQTLHAVKSSEFSPASAEAFFLVLGVAAFSLAPPVGLLVWWMANSMGAGQPLGFFDEALARLSPVLSVAAGTVLRAGLTVQRRAASPNLGAVRTAGTSIALIGALLLLLTVVLAWPQPELLIGVGLCSFVFLLTLAILGDLPLLHVFAVACFALAYLVGYQLATAPDGKKVAEDLPSLIFAARSGAILTLLAMVVGGVGAALRRMKQPHIALSYLWSSVGLAGLSVMIAGYSGFRHPSSDPMLATGVLAFNAVLLLAAAIPMRIPAVTWAGSGLLFAALAHGCCWNPVVSGRLSETLSLLRWQTLLGAALLHANLVAALAAVAWRWRSRVLGEDTSAWRRELVQPLLYSAVISSTLAAPAAVAPLRGEMFAVHAAFVLLVATAWAGVAVMQRWPAGVAAAQGMATVAVGFVTAAVCQRQDWGDGWLQDPRHLQTQATVLAGWCAACTAVRSAAGVRPRWKELLRSDWLSVEQVVVAGLLVVLTVLGVLACWPGVLAELGVAGPTAEPLGDFDYRCAFGPGAWIALAAVTAAMLGSWRERLSAARSAGVLIAAAVAVLLLAARWDEAIAVASALRWLFAFYAAATAAACWSLQPLASVMERSNKLGGGRLLELVEVELRSPAWALGALPVLVLTIWSVLQAQHLAGPGPDTVFARMGPAVSYAGPLLLVVATLLAYAVHERSPLLALGGSAVFQLAVALACLLPVVASPDRRFDTEAAVQLLQWSAVGLGAYALVWLLLRRRIEEPAGATSSGGLLCLAVQITLTCAASALLGIWASGAVFAAPDRLPAALQHLGLAIGYIAVVLAFVSGLWFWRWQMAPSAPHLLAGCGLCVGALASVSVHVWDASGAAWLSYHVLTMAWLAVGLMAAAAACWATRAAATGRGNAAPSVAANTNGLSGLASPWGQLTRPCVTWATVIGALVMLLAIRGSVADPQKPWWSLGAAAAAAVLAAVLALRGRSQPYAYASALGGCVAVTLYWVGVWKGSPEAVLELVHSNLLVLTCVSGVWLAAEIWRQRRRQSVFDPAFPAPPVHQTAAVGVLAVMPLMVLAHALVDAPVLLDVLAIGSIGGLGLLLAASLWDRRAVHALPCIYVWGGVALAFLLVRLPVEAHELFFALSLAAAAYVAITGLMWRQGVSLAVLGQRLGIPDPVASLARTSRWLPGVNLLVGFAAILAGLAVVLGYGSDLRGTWDARAMRTAAGLTPALFAVGVAAAAQQRRRDAMQYLALLLAGLSVVYLGWADMDPSHPRPGGDIWLDRTIRLLIALALLGFLYATFVVRWARRDESWRRAARKAAATMAFGAIAALLLTLAEEAALYQPGVGAPVDAVQIGVVTAMLVGLIVGLLRLALLPGQDPLALSERGRMAYVYAAQVVGALLFAHIYLAIPELFQRRLGPYWPYIVMVIAFAGVFAGEIFQRRAVRVMAEPLQRTGLFLPLLPVLGFWVLSSKTDYSTVLFVVGLLYVFVSIFRKSLWSALAAGLAGNGALWMLLSERGLSWAEHPQFFLIPPALSVLAAAEINRRRLSEQQLTSVRYLCVLVVYLSSTSEMFITGVGKSIWPPMVLALLAVGGAMAGIAMRIRAFLYLGASFVFLAVFTMVWHAYERVEHVAVWWAFGVALGLFVLAVLGLFEKKRSEITRLIERLRQWDR